MPTTVGRTASFVEPTRTVLFEVALSDSAGRTVRVTATKLRP